MRQAPAQFWNNKLRCLYMIYYLEKKPCVFYDLEYFNNQPPFEDVGVPLRPGTVMTISDRGSTKSMC